MVAAIIVVGLLQVGIIVAVLQMGIQLDTHAAAIMAAIEAQKVPQQPPMRVFLAGPAPEKPDDLRTKPVRLASLRANLAAERTPEQAKEERVAGFNG